MPDRIRITFGKKYTNSGVEMSEPAWRAIAWLLSDKLVTDPEKSRGDLREQLVTRHLRDWVTPPSTYYLAFNAADVTRIFDRESSFDKLRRLQGLELAHDQDGEEILRKIPELIMAAALVGSTSNVYIEAIN